MNKTIQKMMLAMAVCGVLCGTAVAAPKGNPPKGGKAPTAMRAQAPKGHTPAPQMAKAPAREHRAAPMARHETRYEIAHHAPPPPPPRHDAHHRHHHHDSVCHCDDLGDVCAGLIGGLIGGLISAVM